MKIALIHGQSHRGSTWHVARMLAEKLGGEVTEFFLPRDFGEYCLGCTACFVRGEEHCPHRQKLQPITEALDAADVIILASPVYVYHATGAMKSLLDHYGYRWMAHRPDARMFSKQAVVVTTAAGAGMKSAARDMADSAFFWGCARTYTIAVGVAATSWSGVSPKTAAKIDRRTTDVAGQVKRRCGRARPGLKTRLFFGIMRMMQKSGWNEADKRYWEERGWLGRARPWK